MSDDVNKADGKRPSPDETMKRRIAVKRLMLERGITNRNDIQRILRLEHPDEPWMDVTRQTIYKDVKAVASVSEDDLKEFELDIISIYKKNIRDLQRLIDREGDSRVRSQLYRTQSQLIKDQHEMASKIALRGRVSGSGVDDGHTRKGVSIGGDARIVFGDVEVEE